MKEEKRKYAQPQRGETEYDDTKLENLNIGSFCIVSHYFLYIFYFHIQFPRPLLFRLYFLHAHHAHTHTLAHTQRYIISVCQNGMPCSKSSAEEEEHFLCIPPRSERASCLLDSCAFACLRGCNAMWYWTIDNEQLCVVCTLYAVCGVALRDAQTFCNIRYTLFIYLQYFYIYNVAKKKCSASWRCCPPPPPPLPPIPPRNNAPSQRTAQIKGSTDSITYACIVTSHRWCWREKSKKKKETQTKAR